MNDAKTPASIADEAAQSGAPEPPRPGTARRDPTGDRSPDGLLAEDFRIEAPTVSLPKGGGAISGMGEKFTANPVTGTASISLPLPLTAGRGGVTPSVGLSYDSGAGNGPFGLGWRVNLPSVRRKTDKGLPRYFDDGEQGDTYVLSDAEDLVPLLVENAGVWEEPTSRTDNYGGVSHTIKQYRPRIEGGFSLIERWKNDTTGRIWWRTISRNNVHRVYGRSDQARLVDPDDTRRVFEWLLEEESDQLGNVISYQYKAEDRAGIDTTHPAERARGDAGSKVAYRYLKRISYGNTVMGNNPDDGLASAFYDPDIPLQEIGQTSSNAGSFLFHLVFDYGEHSASDPELTPTGTWDDRQDPFSRFRAGFDVRCYRLCRRVLMMHVFSEIRDNAGAAVPAVVRSLELTYTERATTTTLASGQLKGWKWNGTSYDTETLPASSFTYSLPTVDETVQLVDGMDDLPAGLDMRQWRWVDLDGEGLSGLLTEQGGGLYYKRNEGDGQLAPARKLPRRPNLSPSSPGVRLVDLDGDGNLDMVVMRPGLAGYQARSDAQADSWEGFRHFKGVPTHTPDDPDVRLIDLDGDGHADLLVTEDEVFTWYPSQARDGFGAPRCRPQAANEDSGPRLVFSRQGEQIFLADMTGDGLTDLVRIRNGSVSYWPNKGYARFGARVHMKGAPRFTTPDQFDPARIRLADLDGSGPTDLLYIGADGVQLYFNEAGNGFSSATVLSRFPSTARPNAVQVADIRGDGTASLVWSSPLLRESLSPLRTVHLMSEGKPWLLKQTDNGLGRTVTLTYTPSTTFYLNDRRAGTPWATRLPFPVQCLSKVESFDAITGWRFVSRYAYHHGYFDGHEREFRGFGMVEQWDTETFADFAPSSPQYDPDIVAQANPIRVKTWFHTGAWRKNDTLTSAYEGEYFDGDDDALHLPAPAIPGGLSAAETREAHRALRGQMLRQEVYAEDGSGNLEVLYTVTEQTFSIQQLQPASGKHTPSFHRVDGQTLSLAYDLDIRPASTDTPDPRVSQSMTLAVDEYGVVTRSAVVSYRRRTPAGGTDADLDAEQKVTRVVVSESDVVHQDSQVDGDNLWRLGIPYQSRAWEFSGTVTGTTSSKNLQDTTALADPSTLNTTFTTLSAANTLSYEDTPPADGYRRLLGHQAVLYWNDLLLAPGSLGAAGLRALPYQKYALALTESLVTDLYGTRVTATMLGDGGYVDLSIDPRDGTTTTAVHWWLPSGRTELDSAAFYHPTEHVDPFGNTTTLTWDTHDLMPTEVESPPAVGLSGMTVTAEIDYRLMVPSKVTDPNDTESEATFDALGRVIETAVRNTTSSDGDATSHSAEFTYTTTALPASVHTKLRKAYGGSDWQESYAYSDGGGNVVQTKVQAAPGDAPERDINGNLVFDTNDVLQWASADPRWVGSGRVIVDNKGNVVRQYEPFFSATHLYEDEKDVVEWGVSAELSYDPIGRNIRVDLPDGNFRTWRYSPWSVSAADENDNIDDTDTTNPGFEHRRTPTTTHLDAQGRLYKTVARPDRTGTEYVTTLTLDIQGNPLTVTDPRGNDIQVQAFDVLGRPAFTGSADEGYDGTSGDGESHVLADVQGQPTHAWRSGSLAFRTAYDNLRRARESWVDEGSGERLVTLTVYGDELIDPLDQSTVEAGFLKGRVAHVYDTAGRVTFTYDFRGLAATQVRRVAADITDELDWSGLESQLTLALINTWLNAGGQLDSETFTVSATYDALGRVTTQTAPDSSETTPTYDEGGRLSGVDVKVLGATPAKTFVSSITYNARGQREKIVYGNHTETEYTYDANTFRLTRLLTNRTSGSTHGTGKLQDLKYTYDPVGNIVKIEDDAQQTLYFDNTQVSPDRTFEYDALYRLTSAKGREKTGMGQPIGGDPALGGLPDSTAANTALRLYEQTYVYDEAGNITEMKHVSGGSTIWRRGYDYETDNNQLKATSRPGDTFGTPSTYSDLYNYNERGAMDFMPHLKTGVSTNITRDFRDQIRKADLDSSGNVSWYAYDAGGIRVRKVWMKGSVEEERIYIGNGWEVWRKRTSGTLSEERETLHIMDDSRRICMVETETTASPNAVTRYRFQYADHLGTAAVEAADDGGLITYEEFHPYGTTAWWAEKSGIQVSRKRYRYTGMEKDEGSKLSYHNARYYMTWLGRWERPDQIGLGDGLNRFEYVRGNPIRFLDVTGRGRDDFEAGVSLPPGAAADEPLSSTGFFSPLVEAAGAVALYNWSELQEQNPIYRNIGKPILSAGEEWATAKVTAVAEAYPEETALVQQKLSEVEQTASVYGDAGLVVGAPIWGRAAGAGARLLIDALPDIPDIDFPTSLQPAGGPVGIGVPEGPSPRHIPPPEQQAQLDELTGRNGSTFQMAGSRAIKDRFGFFRVPYGNDALSAKVLNHRIGLTDTKLNLAVFEYIDPNGNKVISDVFENIPANKKTGEIGVHSEAVGLVELAKMGITPDKITRVYTELAPCGPTNAGCRGIMQSLTNAEVSYTFTTVSEKKKHFGY